MIEARVDEAEGDHLDVEQPRDQGVGAEVGAEAVAAEEPLADEERVAGPLEGDLVGDPVDGDAAALEGVPPEGLLALPLGMAEAAQHRLATAHHRSVRGEHHVGQAGLLVDQLHPLAEEAVCVVERLPLRERHASVDLGLDVHPRIDLVLDPVMVGAAHEDGHDGSPGPGAGRSPDAWSSRTTGAPIMARSGCS